MLFSVKEMCNAVVSLNFRAMKRYVVARAWSFQIDRSNDNLEIVSDQGTSKISYRKYETWSVFMQIHIFIHYYAANILYNYYNFCII